MQVAVQGLGQTLSFKSGEVENHMLLEFPDGRVVQVGIDADTAAYVTSAFVGSGGPAAQRAIEAASSAGSAPRARKDHHMSDSPPGEMPGSFAPMSVDGEDDVFGGDYGATTPDEGWQDPAAEEAEPAPVPTVANLSTKRGALRVSADAKGNPVIQGGNVVDQHELTGGIGAADEEDGVGSV